MDHLLEQYIRTHIDPEPPELYRIDRETNLRTVNGRMCSGHIQGRLLKMLVAMARPRKILELGTFSGYSALCMAEALDEGATVDTIEIDDEMESFILNNFKSSPHGSKIHLHIGDALTLMQKWPENEFDLIFIDADKRKYTDYYILAKRLLKEGGFIIADNTLWDEHVVEEGKHSSQTQGILAFNKLVAEDNDVETAILPVRDGLTLLRKKQHLNDNPETNVIK